MHINLNLLAVLVLFQGKDMLIEVFLELLVGKIYVELFKSVHFEILESKNVEHSNKGKLVLPSSDSHVDSLQDPTKTGWHKHASQWNHESSACIMTHK